MPFAPKPVPPNVMRSVVIQVKGPKSEKQIERLNAALKKVAKKHGARFKKRPKAKGN